MNGINNFFNGIGNGIKGLFSPLTGFLTHYIGDPSAQLLAQALIQLTELTGSLGAAIIIFTVIARSILFPIAIPSIKAQKQIRDLKPELDKLKQKHGKDRQALNMAQMELYKKYNVNPFGGCLPQLLQIAILITMYHALTTFFGADGNQLVNGNFLWFNLAQPDPLYIMPVLVAVTQLIFSVMIAPGGETPDIVSNTSKKKAVQAANEQEEDAAEMALAMQQNMLFFFPIITAIASLGFPSGLTLYWVINTLYSIFQQFVLSGPGGLTTYTKRALAVLNFNRNTKS